MPTVCRTTDSAGADGSIGKKVSIGKEQIVSKIQIIETIYSENTRKIEKYFEIMLDKLYLMKYNEDNKNKEATKRKASENGGRSNGLLNLTTKKSLNEFT